MAIHVLVNNSGGLISGTPGDDLKVDGDLDLDGNSLTTGDNLSGVLLTGEVLGFGYAEAGATDRYDFRFAVTGGLLASMFAGKDIGITVQSENSTFNNDFTLDFTGGAKGNIGAINPLPAHIIVDKITDPAGDATSFNFNATGTGYSGFGLTDAATPNDQLLVPGTYSVSELTPPGWDLTGLTVVDPTGDSSTSGSTATLSLRSGETIHVTYTNTKRGHIVVDKITDPAGDPTSFTFNATGSGYAGFGLTDADTPNDQELAPGSYSVAELVPAGWDLSDLVVVDPTGDSTTLGSTATLSLAAGETIHVTFTDTKRAHIVVDKITNPAGDPTSFTFNATGTGYSGFGLTDADAPNDQELSPGSYSIAELVPAGWDLSNLVVVDPTNDSTSSGSTATLALAAGETIHVTFTDTKRGRIIVDKVTNPAGDPTSFTFNTTGTGYAGFDLADADTPNDQELAPGTYSVAELVPAGWNLASLTVVDPSGDSTTLGSTANLTLAAGETITVTFTDAKKGHIVVDKVTNPAGDPTSFTFNTTGTGYAGFGLTDADAPNDQLLDAGTYSVAELVPAGWNLASLTVVDPSGDSTTLGSTANLTLAAGETITVTFTDAKKGHIVVDKVTNPAGDPTSFTFNTTGTGYAGFGLTDADAPNDQLLDAGTYSVAELVPAGWNLASLTVVDPSGGSTTLGSTATLSLAAGETITVTFTDAKMGHIVVDKVTTPAGDPTSFTFNTTGTGYAGFGLTDAATPNDQLLAPGTYSVSELVPAGWTLASLTIVDPSGGSTKVGSTATLSLAAGETILVTYCDTKLSGTISGTKYLDVSGNGLTGDDTPMSNVKIYLDTNNNGVWNTGEPSMLTAANGTYSFTGLSAGTYTVREVMPDGFVRTAPTLLDKYTVNLPAGGTSPNNNFANAEVCDKSVLSDVVYIINGTTAVTDLRGNTNEGDTVQVTFTYNGAAGPHKFTLVSYTAPGATFVAADAYQQTIFDVDSGVFTAGTYTLTVTIPHSFYQVDFVCGCAIDHFGPEGSNIFYSAQNRLFSADNDGTHAVLANGGSLSGFAYADFNNNGQVDMTDRVIPGVIVKLTGTSNTNQSISQASMTDTDGRYTFDNLPAGTYTISETQFISYTDGTDSIGSLGGSKQNDKFTSINLPSGGVGINYNFGEKQVQGSAYAANQTATVAFWSSTNGQNLIKALNGGSTAKNLGNWLASNFNNIYGVNSGTNDLTGKTNSQVASYYQSLFSSSSKKLEAQTMALALAVYVTDSDLAGTTATSYGFAVSTTGLGSATVNVSDSGAAFGLDDYTIITIMELLQRTNLRTKLGVLWDTGGNGLSGAENILRSEAFDLFSTINNT